MSFNPHDHRDRAVELLKAVDDLQQQAKELDYVPLYQAQNIQAAVGITLAQAQVHALLAQLPRDPYL